jgi:PEP-CTERM motif
LISTQSRSILRYVCIVLFSMAFLIPAAKADSVNYTFNGSNGSFSYTSDSGFIAPGDSLTLYTSDMNSCNGCSYLSFLPSANIVAGVPIVGDLLEFGGLANLDIYAFQYGAFGAYGTYNSYWAAYGSGTLSVTRGPVGAPEPSTLGLLAIGLMLMVGLASRKRIGAMATPVRA